MSASYLQDLVFAVKDWCFWISISDASNFMIFHCVVRKRETMEETMAARSGYVDESERDLMNDSFFPSLK
ncbi:hypothetical protein DY000_02027432 [Brassica cretica]|nr:hypothetical protein DY000_02027432 [Brassica cretica]